MQTRVHKFLLSKWTQLLGKRLKDVDKMGKDDHQRCIHCGKEEFTGGNPMYLCDGCNCGLHKRCSPAGIGSLPTNPESDPFFCHRCMDEGLDAMGNIEHSFRQGMGLRHAQDSDIAQAEATLRRFSEMQAAAVVENHPAVVK